MSKENKEDKAKKEEKIEEIAKQQKKEKEENGDEVKTESIEREKVESVKEKEVKAKTGEKIEKADKKVTGKVKTEAKKEAIVRGKDLPISTLHANAICKFIKNKKIEEAIKHLENVIKKKIAVPFKGEIPHRKGMMSGRFPIKASEYFIKMLRSLSANASVNGLDLEKVRISAIANKAPRPYKRFGSERFKRTHVIIKVKQAN